MATKFWFVYVQSRPPPTISYNTEPEAKRVAESLACSPENQGLKVFLLTAYSYCMATKPVRWSSTQDA